jgi:lipopolysaccharide biosynthesis glycosyltransferase
MLVDITLTNGINIIIIKPLKELNISIDNKVFRLRNKINYYIIKNNVNNVNNVNKFNINIERLYNQKIIDIHECIEYIGVYSYGNPKKSDIPYEIIYSFDSNYFAGAFASIYSLIKNFNQIKLKLLNLYLCVPESDFNEIDINLKKFIGLNTINPHYTLILTTHDLASNVFQTTKCYKGGSHLLKLSNYCRLIVCNLINSEKLLYLDSDTIIQSDLSLLLTQTHTQTHTQTYAFSGKKSDLTYNNLININNKTSALEFLGNDFDLDKNIIYTGTMILNTNIIKNNFHRIIDLVKKHNETKDGIYKLFTMSIINLSMANNIGFCENLINTVDLGFRNGLENEIEKSDVLDWSGIYKPWFRNGLYKEYWMKYNIMFKSNKYIMYNKDTVESNLQ